MKNKLFSILAVALTVALFFGCSKKAEITIAVPNDPTNEGRALLLLQDKGYITLKSSAGITATINDIEKNDRGIKFNEVEAAQLPNTLKDVDYAIINSNYALDGGLNPTTDSLIAEGSHSIYVNIIGVKEGRENDAIIKALVAAVASQKVQDFIKENYDGAVVGTVENPTDGYNASVNYDELQGKTITIAATPTPHVEILEVAREILAEKGIKLDIKEFTDYIQPNNVVESGEVDANYFQHLPYLDDFNAQNGTHIVNVLGVHVEPMGLYGGKQKTLDALK